MRVLQGAVGVMLVALATGPAYATLLAASAATFQPISMEFGEASIYGATLRILQNQPLYQAIDVPPFTIVPYTPLYYFAAAALRAAFGEGFGPGRVLSLVAGLCAAVLDYPLEAQDNTVFGRIHAWPDAVFQALEDTMQPAGELANRDVYTPRPHPSGACASST